MSGALTSFGNHCRALRTQKNLMMGDQAQALQCEVHHISAIETGRIAPTAEYVENLSGWLQLKGGELKILTKRMKSNVVSLQSRSSTKNNSTSMRLFRKISKLDPNQIRKFREKIDRGANDD
jgi:transcriptional regulator with XRE-family HTH domain